MDHILANADTLVRDYTNSLSAIYPDRFQTIPNSYNGRALLRNPIQSDRVNLIVSGGGGGYPLTGGYVSSGMADVSINGNLHAAPSAYDIYEAAKYIGSTKGYLLIYNNFMGDCLNNDLAAELLAMEGISSRLCICTDDCLSVPPDRPHEERTGLTGFVYLIKIGAACAAKGLSLDETYKIVSHANQRLSSVSLTFDFEKQQLCLGAGFSGEPPVKVFDNCFSMKEAAAIVYDLLINDLHPNSDEKLHLFVHRLKKTRYEEAFIFAKELNTYASTLHHPFHKLNAGFLANIMDEHGFFITILCEDEILRPYMNETINTGAFILQT